MDLEGKTYKYKIAILIPYFTASGGRFPDFFEYWQKSAGANKNIDFFIPTNVDTDLYMDYENIHFISMAANVFFDNIQELFEFRIVRDCYKIGEFRPLCGILFKDILKEYDYWGYSEFDLIYGDILKFIQENLDAGEEVIGGLGHFRLIKNCDRLNYLPFEKSKFIAHPLNMKEAYTTCYCCHFDEVQGMGVKYHQAGMNVINLSHVIADIDQKFKYFAVLNKTGKWGFTWKRGTLTGYNDKNEEKEFLYVHFQKRKLEIDVKQIPGEVFCMVPNHIMNGCAGKNNIAPPTAVYTLKNRIQYYKKLRKDSNTLDYELKCVLSETSQFCQVNKLFH